ADRAGHFGAERAAQRGLVLERRADDGRCGFLRGGQGRARLFHADRLGRAAARSFVVVRVTAVACDPVVGACGSGRGAARRRVGTVAGDRHGAVAGEGAAFALAVVEQLPADRAGHFGAERAAQRGLVLERRADDGRCGFLRGGQGRARLFHADRLGRAAARSFVVVRVTAVGGDPVVGACGSGRGAARRRVGTVAGDRHGAVAGDGAAFALAVVEQLPADRAGHFGAERAAQRGLVLERRADDGRCGFLRGGQGRARLFHADRLGRAAARSFVVVRV